MELTIHIHELPYAKLLSLALPSLRSGLALPAGAAGKLLKLLLDLPEEILGTAVDAIPARELDEVLSMLVEERQTLLLAKANGLLQRQGIEATIQRISLSRELEVQVYLCGINYAALASRFLPMLQGTHLQDSPEGLLTRLKQAPGFLVRTILAAIPRETLDKTAVTLIHKNRGQLCRMLEAQAAQRGLDIEVLSIDAK